MTLLVRHGHYEKSRSSVKFRIPRSSLTPVHIDFRIFQPVRCCWWRGRLSPPPYPNNPEPLGPFCASLPRFGNNLISESPEVSKPRYLYCPPFLSIFEALVPLVGIRLWNIGCRHVQQSPLVYDSIAYIHKDAMDTNGCSQVLRKWLRVPQRAKLQAAFGGLAVSSYANRTIALTERIARLIG